MPKKLTLLEWFEYKNPGVPSRQRRGEYTIQGLRKRLGCSYQKAWELVHGRRYVTAYDRQVIREFTDGMVNMDTVGRQ